MDSELAPGVMLGERYEIRRTLGRGGFAVTYIALDAMSNQEVVVKELFPHGATRTPEGVRLPDGTERAAYQFLREARTLARLRFDGVVNVLDAFPENGTAYVVMEYRADALPLERILRSEGPLEPGRVQVLLQRLCGILSSVHDRGFLHRDIKPSNILLAPGDEPFLIDFGAAREWQADATVKHTTIFTPGYAPIEQLSEMGRRGPSADIYALAATGYEMLCGRPPVSSIDRVSGVALEPLPRDIDQLLAQSVLAGLALKAADRPQSAAAFSEMLSRRSLTHAVTERSVLQEMDAALAALAALKPRRNECPSCGGLLTEPKPLRPGNCPNCRTGKLRRRILDARKCALCRSGFVRQFSNVPLVYCPICRFGKLVRPGMLKRSAIRCIECGAHFSVAAKRMLRLDAYGSKHSALADVGDVGEEHDFWLDISGRSERCAECEACSAQWDVARNGRLQIVHWKEDPHNITLEHRSLLPEEWARLAAKLPIDAGNFVCGSCEADFYVDAESATLVDAPGDPFGFAATNQGRRLLLEALQWAGVGKPSGARGVCCESCVSEFDFDGNYLRLRASEQQALCKRLDEAKTLEDWHRIARGLPEVSDENMFRERFRAELVDGLLTGELGLRDDGFLFAASARIVEGNKELAKGELRVTSDRVEFDSRKTYIAAPLDTIADFSSEGDTLQMSLSGEASATAFQIPPFVLEVQMRSGRYEVTLTAADAAQAIANGLEMAVHKPDLASRSV